MNADFFHPTWGGRKCVTVDYDRFDSLDGYWDEAEWRLGGGSEIDVLHQHGQDVTDGMGDIAGEDRNQILANR